MFHRWIPSLILALILVCFVCAVAPCAVIRVTTTGNNSNDGSTWALAKLTIDNAITAASSGDEVWVKVGSYAASTTISLKEGVNVYGGFAGTESSRQDRTLDWQSPSTVDGITNYTDNGSVFIAPTGVTVATILDGFKVTGGSGTLLSGYYLGGGIYVAGSGLTISNCHIEGNTGNKGAGILALTGTHTHIHNCTVSGNDGTLGAGIYVYNGEVLDSIVTQNGTAANCQYGGGIRVGAYTSDCLIQNTEISHNACANRGGGIYVDTGAAPTIEDCDIHENETVDYGAGIFATSSSPVISGCSIKANKLYGTGGGSRSGAGIAGYTISPQITDCTIEDNYIVDSASTYGAGIYVSTGSPVIRNNIIRNNDAAGNGSGVMLTGTVIFDVSENIIYGNDCVGNLSKGGGIAVYGTSYGTIERNKIYSNTAVTKGGGIYFSSASETATTITSNLIYSNSATDGSGVYILSGTCTLHNNTIAANSSDGVYLISPGTATLTNNIVALNVRGLKRYNTSPTMTLTYNDVYGNTGANFVNITDPTGSSGNISQDPLFTNSGSADYTIQSGSPCRDTGDNAVVASGALDVIGANRILNTIVDMGAYENLASDTTPPTPGTASSPGYNATSTIAVTYTGASDEAGGSGLKKVELWYKFGLGGTWTNSNLTNPGGSGGFTFTPANGPGVYYFDLVAEDYAGNRSDTPTGSGDTSTIFTYNLNACSFAAIVIPAP